MLTLWFILKATLTSVCVENNLLWIFSADFFHFRDCCGADFDLVFCLLIKLLCSAVCSCVCHGKKKVMTGIIIIIIFPEVVHIKAVLQNDSWFCCKVLV